HVDFLSNGHQFTLSNRHQELASPEQTASALAIQGQTETGKESSNSLMADSFPKTIQSNDPPLSRGYTLGSGEDSLKLMELMEFNLDQLSIHQMANLEFCDKHNMVAYLEKPEGSAEFHQIIDFLTASIDGQAKTITEASLRRHLKLEDDGGITSLPNTEIFEQLALMGYATDSDKLTFQKELLTSPNSSLMEWGYSGDDIPLFPSMITAPESSPSQITSLQSLSPQHTPVSAPSTSPPLVYV
ncbi:hypothetical protein Tco_1495811, partial [Tanacetum coccineum]